MKQYIMKIVDSVITMVSIIIFLIAAVVIVSVIKTPQGEPPMIFGRTMFQVVSPSMEPALRIGTVVMVKKTDISEVKEGDIISFYTRDPDIYNSVVTHRVDEVEDRDGVLALRTKGDANPSRDAYTVKERQLIGKVVGHSNVIGSFVMLLSYRWIFALLIILPMAYIVISNGYKMISSLRRDKTGNGDNSKNDEE